MNSSDSLHLVSVCGPVRPNHAALKRTLPQQIGDFFANLFDTSDWPARWHCGTWSDFHGWLYIFSDLLIWASYFAIPVMLFRLVTKRSDIPFKKIFWLFAAFIILCGLTHFLDAIIFWWPAYRISALVRFLTGVVSLFTVFALYKILPFAFTLRSVEELEHEIAERKKAEEKLAANEFLLSEAGRIGRVGGWEFHVADKRAVWSKVVYDIYELPYDFEIGPNTGEYYFPEPYKQMLLDAVAIAAKDKTSWDLELKMLTAKNHEVWVRSYGEPFFDADSQLIKFRGVLMDINTYKTNELRLNKSMELLTQQNQQLKSFAHILSHNIRNHASNITLLTRFIEPATLDENNADMFSKITKVSNSLNTTLDDLADAIRIRESVLTSEELDFKTVADKVIEVLSSDISAVQAVVHLDFNVPKVFFPAIYLESIIMNLLSNSIKYRKEDVDPIITFKTYKDANGHTVLECIDNGIGIDLKLHGEKIFGLYKTFTYRKDAHGVGLFLIKNQVESQGGEISVKSKLNEGTTFKIIFNEKN